MKVEMFCITNAFTLTFDECILAGKKILVSFKKMIVYVIMSQYKVLGKLCNEM